MITRDFWSLTHPDAPMSRHVGTRAQVEEWRNRRPIPGRDPESYVVEPHAYCTVCGVTSFPLAVGVTTWQTGAMRCEKHHDRHACAIEGCQRTRAVTEGHAPCDDQTMCAEHWRRFVPPGSRARRAYHAYFRQAKRHGWGYKGKRGRSARLDYRFRVFWDALVRMARRRATEGDLDEAQIKAMFGWD